MWTHNDGSISLVVLRMADLQIQQVKKKYQTEAFLNEVAEELEEYYMETWPEDFCRAVGKVVERLEIKEDVFEGDYNKEPCKYCGGNCPNEPDDSSNLCDGFQGDIDNLYTDEEEEEEDDLFQDGDDPEDKHRCGICGRWCYGSH